MTSNAKPEGAVGASLVQLPAVWKHLGGGCSLDCGDGLSCDDDYEEAGTGWRVRFVCTPEAHFSLFPSVIRDMDAFLAKLAGRRDIRVGLPPPNARARLSGPQADATKSPSVESEPAK